MVAYRTDRDPNEIGYLCLKVKVTVTQYPCFFIILCCGFQLLCVIKLKFDIPLRYALGRFAFEFHKNEWAMTSLSRHLNYLRTVVHISNSTELTNFAHGTNINNIKHL